MISYFDGEGGQPQVPDQKSDKQKFVEALLSTISDTMGCSGLTEEMFDQAANFPRFPREHFLMSSHVWKQADRDAAKAWTLSGLGQQLTYPSVVSKKLHLISEQGGVAMAKLADSTAPNVTAMQIFSVFTVIWDENPLLTALIKRAKTVQVCLADQSDNRAIYEFHRRGTRPVAPGEFPLDELMIP